MTSARKPTKAKQVQQRLLEEIINGKFFPGEKLAMDVLKEQYGVAYSVLREALTSLIATGIVEREEQCGFSVSQLSIDEFHDLYQLRIHLECFALKLAIQNGDQHWEAEVLSSWHLYENFLKKADVKTATTEWSHYHEQFRSKLVTACNSPWLLKLRLLLQDQALRYRMLCYQHSATDKLKKKILNMNSKLATAVIQRDEATAEKLLRESWHESMQAISKALTSSFKK